MATTTNTEEEKKFPTGYQSQYKDQIQGLYDQIANRKDFTYDVNADAMYQQLKDQYVQGGRMAMMDTMGQAQAMTGGYGNSYAQGVGQQAYHGYLQGLNDQVPNLYQMALNRYIQQGDQLTDQYSMASWAASITAATAGVTPLRKTFPDGETYFLPFITPMVEGTLSALEAVTPVRWPSIGSDCQSNTKFCEYAGTAASSITSRERVWRKRFILRGFQ